MDVGTTYNYSSKKDIVKTYAPFLTALTMALAAFCAPVTVLAKSSKVVTKASPSPAHSTTKKYASNKAAKVLVTKIVRPKAASLKTSRLDKIVRPKAASLKTSRLNRSAGLTSQRRKARLLLVPRVFAEPVEQLSADGTPRLQSQAALVIDQETQKVLFRKNDRAVLPIASITKLMTALLISQAHLPMDEEIAISTDDVDTEKGSRSRLVIGSALSRSEMLHLALMSSENRAAHALARTYPGGLQKFVGLMNAKAAQLGMKETRYVDPTGLSSQNQSTAHDLAILVKSAHESPLVRQYSTDRQHDVTVGSSVLQYNTTNALIKDPNWQIGLQKTGYISEAGRCMVVQAMVAGRRVIMVFLDSATAQGRIADAKGVRRWLERGPARQTMAIQSFPENLR